MDRLFDQLWEGGLLSPFSRLWPEWADFGDPEGRIPRVDIVDEDATLLVRAELPGIAKENLDVSMTDDYLTIKGETREEIKEGSKPYHSEMHHGSFSRTLQLPVAVRGEDAQANFHDGVLEIRLPKAEEAKRHAINVE